MNTSQLVHTLVAAGIDPASVVVRTKSGWNPGAAGSHPGLRPINGRQLAVLQQAGLPVRALDLLWDARHVGAAVDPSLVHIFAGWNVWSVDQVDDIPTWGDPFLWGVSQSTQLRIWVEDQIRENAPGADVADPLAFKGSQIEILAGVPTGLTISQTKENVPGPPMLTDGASSMQTVRFFNRGFESNMPWPHDKYYILDRTYTPSPTAPATTGPGPGTIIDRNVVQPGEKALEGVAVAFGVAALAMLGYGVLQNRRSR